MTTIAYVGGIMAADTLMSRGREITTGAKKIFATGHYLIGFSGSYGVIPALLEFLKDGEGATDGDATLFHKVWADKPDFAEEFCVLLVNRHGTVFYGGDTPPVIVARPFEAIGTGAQFAIGSMAYGAGAKRAVKIAAGLDAFTGGEVISLSLKDIGR